MNTYLENATAAMAVLLDKTLSICPIKRVNESDDDSPYAAIITDQELDEIAKTAYRMADAMDKEKKQRMGIKFTSHLATKETP